MYGLKNNPKINQQYFKSLNKSLITMLNHSHGNHSLTGFILDTAYCYPTQINLDANKVTEGKCIFIIKNELSLTVCYIFL